MKYITFGAVCALIAVPCTAIAQTSPCDRTVYTQNLSTIVDNQPLTLRTALDEIRRVSPSVRAAGLETLALAAEASERGRKLNPTVSLSFENFSGGGIYSGFDETEASFVVEQTFQLGNKRKLAQKAGQALQTLARSECKVTLRDAELEAAILFVELKHAVAIQKLAAESKRLADTLADTAAKRVEAGAAAPLELSRARTEAMLANANMAYANVQINKKRYALSALWGEVKPRFSLPTQNHNPMSLPRAVGEESPHPSQNFAEAASEVARAEQRYQRSRIVPDVTLSAGLRRFENSGDSAFIAGVSIPLPLFNRNKDRIRAANYRTQLNAINTVSVNTKLRSRQNTLQSEFRAVQSRLNGLQNQALPTAQSAYDASLRGYAVGKFDLSTTISSRKSLIETRFAAINAELDLQKIDLQLRNLTGSAPFTGE